MIMLFIMRVTLFLPLYDALFVLYSIYVCKITNVYFGFILRVFNPAE